MKKETKRRTHIRGFVNVLPEKEKEHMRRVGVLTGTLTEMAYESGIYKDDAAWNGYKHFGAAAFYHDIGKVWIPRELLMKNRALTKEEGRMMQLHPVHARILYEEFEDGVVFGIPKHLLLPAFQAAEYHHERWDGNGYPYGIGTVDIPLIARIIAICDAYDTITNKRTYKDAMSHEIACRELQANAGTQFDPVLTQIFLENENTFARLKEDQICEHQSK
jgi:HD-GYP domain